MRNFFRKSAITAALIVGAAFAHADPAPFGFELGKATAQDFEKGLPGAKPLPPYFVAGKSYSFIPENRASIQQANFHFDDSGVLVYAVAHITYKRWNDVVAGIADKYKRSNYVFQKELVTPNTKYLAPFSMLMRATTGGAPVFEDGESIIYADKSGINISYFRLSVHPVLAADAAKYHENLVRERKRAAAHQL